jgi:hypothetical protein
LWKASLWTEFFPGLQSTEWAEHRIGGRKAVWTYLLNEPGWINDTEVLDDRKGDFYTQESPMHPWIGQKGKELGCRR